MNSKTKTLLWTVLTPVFRPEFLRHNQLGLKDKVTPNLVG